MNRRFIIFTLVDYIKKMLGGKGISDERAAMVKAMHDENVDIR